MMTHPSWKRHADRQSSEWLDGQDDVQDDGERRRHEPDRLLSADSEAESYLADLLLVDALLTNMSDTTDDPTERRIRKVMDAIHEKPVTNRSRGRLLRWASFTAVAACLLVAVTLFWIHFEKQSLANEVLLAVREVCSKTADRIYSITRVIPSHDAPQLPHGKLYMRGRKGFVITWKDVVLGRYDDQFWLVGPDQQVTISDNFEWIDSRSTNDEFGLRILQELSLESRHVPLMQLAAVAELMQRDYEVDLSQGRLADQNVDLLVGRRRDNTSNLPTTIRLWSNTYSRIIQRAELRWEEGNAIIMELASSKPLSAEWYKYGTHCDGAPTVRRIAPDS